MVVISVFTAPALRRRIGHDLGSAPNPVFATQCSVLKISKQKGIKRNGTC